VRCWDNRNDAYHPIEIIKGFKDSVSQVKVHGAQILCASMDGSVRVFDIRKGEVTTDYLSEAVQRFDVAHSRKAYAVSATNDTL
jgi:mitogen-activated protein kinase organizer 1